MSSSKRGSMLEESPVRSISMIKRLREDSGTSVRSLDSVETAKHVDQVKKIALLELQVSKLKDDNESLRIDRDSYRERSLNESLRQDEGDKASRDKLLAQRTKLYEKNKELSAELDSVSESFRIFHKEASERKNKLLGEMGELKAEVIRVTGESEGERRRAAHELLTYKQETRAQITDRDCKIIQLQNQIESQKETISDLSGSLDSISARVSEFSRLEKSEFDLRMQLDSMKDKEVFVSVFPEKIVRSQEVHSENCRLQREIKLLREEKENSSVLKIKIEDLQGTVTALKQQITDYHLFKEKCESLTEELACWGRVKEELRISNPKELVSTVSSLQKDAVLRASSLERYRSEVSALREQLAESQASLAALTERSEREEDRVGEIRSQLTSAEARARKYRDEAETYRQLCENYRSGAGEPAAAKARSEPKVLHMTFNPSTDKLKDEVRLLKDENRRLTERLDNLEPASSEQQQQLETCQRRLQEREQVLKKTQKIFQTKIRELKKNVENMFGYSMTSPEEQQFSLVSVYADSPDNNLLLKEVDGAFQLVETKYTQSIDMQVHLSKFSQHRSLPLFLCEITSDLFHRRTIMD